MFPPISNWNWEFSFFMNIVNSFSYLLLDNELLQTGALKSNDLLFLTFCGLSGVLLAFPSNWFQLVGGLERDLTPVSGGLAWSSSYGYLVLREQVPIGQHLICFASCLLMLKQVRWPSPESIWWGTTQEHRFRKWGSLGAINKLPEQ